VELWQVAVLPHHWHKPCLVSSVQILWHLLQYPVIAYPLALRLGKRSGQGFVLYSIVKVLLFSSYIIQQKEGLFTNRMNLYLRDILGGAFFKSKKKALLPTKTRRLIIGGRMLAVTRF